MPFDGLLSMIVAFPCHNNLFSPNISLFVSDQTVSWPKVMLKTFRTHVIGNNGKDDIRTISPRLFFT